ncbi:MAG: hypothetical protein WAS27_03075 [Candidatus Saccharimonadales bacterium]
MIGLNHAGTGIIIALTVKRPELAIPLAFVSHFVLDMIPHSRVAHNKTIMAPYLVVEALGATILTVVCMVAFPASAPLIMACAFAAYLPDLLWPFYYGYGVNLAQTQGFKQFFAFHKSIQWSETYRGWLVELLYWCIVIAFLVTY